MEYAFNSSQFHFYFFYTLNRSQSLPCLGYSLTSNELKNVCSIPLYINPFTAKSDQCQISPAASLEILHHTVWRTWLFVAYSDERWLCCSNSHYLTCTFPFRKGGRINFSNLGVKWLTLLFVELVNAYILTFITMKMLPTVSLSHQAPRKINTGVLCNKQCDSCDEMFRQWIVPFYSQSTGRCVRFKN